ncbi:flagellar basal body rod protein FlgB [Terriglobus saanensis]|uniref:Flagellar basal body rod protein FlgB n=1 Tax=Terriglobus saanensis (strain ATCC BAA-1853 / DSM 23119 / SP1PR4) TaxID=401053 RepID=E8V4Y7_TERSS|nr:flagellar basal body rod protein FlgB [Terriglobus saanensis]ADV82615.1 flagellar basal-body rod protein FlgB [Terriglobus saanensis SP1PR4]
MQIETPMAAALSHYLDLSTQQMKMTAGNMANVDTPEYKTQGFDFEREFANALHKPVGQADSAQIQSAEVEGLVSRPDGNNVSMDREAMQLAKTQLQFKTGVELLKREYSRVMDAIRSESK